MTVTYNLNPDCPFPGWHSLVFWGDTFDAFYERASDLCKQVCAEAWVMDYYEVYFESEADALLVQVAF